MDTEHRPRAMKDMIALCWKIDTQLTEICAEILDSDEKPHYWPSMAKARRGKGPPDVDVVVPVAFQFDSLASAQLQLTIWMTQAILWHGMTQLYWSLHLLEPLTPDSTETDLQDESEMCSPATQTEGGRDTFRLRPLEHRNDFITPVFNIIQSVEYCLEDDFLDLGPKAVAPSLRLAMDILTGLSGYEREVKWASEIMIEIQGRSLRMLGFYVELWPREPNQAEIIGSLL